MVNDYIDLAYNERVETEDDNDNDSSNCSSSSKGD